ncbi:MAG: repressor LexA [alpha proteobacterium MED-G10]|nr:repressor LexA [Rickettsiales bacterium]PDH55611.1 MAG: repressor LexA [alpha proteobacterium MED-G10]|tara:strand:- start:7 stop:618 length:612 start_codon:yes stop_codon:yes gene_type:complete
MLTLKQKELLDFIVDYFHSKNIYPTFDEMRKFLNIKSKSGVHKLLSSLEDKGVIERLPHKARALKLKNVIDFPKTDEKNLPFLGRIAAGNPIEAITGSFEQISVPNYLLNSKDEHFTLEVAGDSMNDEGIRDGDIVVIKKIDQAKTGDIIVALIDDNEVTLKRFRSYKNSIALEPANKNYKTRIFGEDRVKVQGKLVGLIRKF